MLLLLLIDNCTLFHIEFNDKHVGILKEADASELQLSEMKQAYYIYRMCKHMFHIFQPV